MKIIVTGSKGLIGTEVTRYLRERHKVSEYDLGFGHNFMDESLTKDIFVHDKADALVNLFAMNDHVGEGREGSGLMDVPLESLASYFAINLTGLFSVCREYARNNTTGAIVNFSSTLGLGSPLPHLYPDSEKHIGYGVSKAGVIQMTKHLAVHLAPRIRVNCIAPGGVRFKQGEEFIKAYSEAVPIGRMMEVHELNKMVEFLCSEDSSYVTGAVFNCDGGWTSW